MKTINEEDYQETINYLVIAIDEHLLKEKLLRICIAYRRMNPIYLERLLNTHYRNMETNRWTCQKM